jgi:hypothetical protein
MREQIGKRNLEFSKPTGVWVIVDSTNRVGIVNKFTIKSKA